MFKLHRFIVVRPRFWRLSLFEKVILANSIILIGEALAGLWVTSHNVEAHHYLIDTSFLIGATLIGILLEGIEEMPSCKRPALYETALFRIAQESLTNVARHAQADHVFLSLIQQHNQLHLRVRDDGCGYNPLHHTIGSGLFGMRERATSLDGTFDIQSQPGQGTLVQVMLPLPVQRATERTEGIHV